MRYKFYQNGNKVICVSSFAGKAVRGVAKCDTTMDTFDEQFGKDLSQARCDLKIAEKRVKRSQDRYNEAVAMVAAANEYLARMTAYRDESAEDYDLAVKTLTILEARAHS